MGLIGRLAAVVATVLLTIFAARAQEVTVSAAISMKEVVEELGRGFAAGQPDLTLRYNFGSSGELQKQIEAGAAVDLFIAAAQRQMDELQQQGLIELLLSPHGQPVLARHGFQPPPLGLR
jgi:ABC-type molybdate transport system substrate-binding protein